MIKKFFDLGRKELKKLEKIADKVLALEEEFKSYSDDQLKENTNKH